MFPIVFARNTRKFRSVLAHDYGEVLLERIWLVVERNVPPLVKQLSELLPKDSG
jgi:uncharacterized protein with HEPN domain